MASFGLARCSPRASPTSSSAQADSHNTTGLAPASPSLSCKLQQRPWPPRQLLSPRSGAEQPPTVRHAQRQRTPRSGRDLFPFESPRASVGASPLRAMSRFRQGSVVGLEEEAEDEEGGGAASSSASRFLRRAHALHSRAKLLGSEEYRVLSNGSCLHIITPASPAAAAAADESPPRRWGSPTACSPPPWRSRCSPAPPLCRFSSTLLPAESGGWDGWAASYLAGPSCASPGALGNSLEALLQRGSSPARSAFRLSPDDWSSPGRRRP